MILLLFPDDEISALEKSPATQPAEDEQSVNADEDSSITLLSPELEI